MKDNMVVNKCGGYISKLILNDGSSININQNDIVVFVGPNNVGKSQTLKDIYGLCQDKVPTTIVKDVKIIKTGNNIFDYLENISTINDYGNRKEYSGFGYSFNNHSINDYARNAYYGSVRPIFVAYLDTMSRLGICQPASLLDRGMPKNHPIHFIINDSECRKWISDQFRRSFGKDLIPFKLYGNSIPLCIGDNVILNGTYDNEEARQEAYAKILDTYDQVQNQGDGIKSFVGLLLYLMIKSFCTFLIDEPESFLHPPQANIMGRIIGETLKDNQQAFISTHSEEIIKGLLDACPERVKIIRIKREEKQNKFAVLSNVGFLNIWNDPILRHTNIMSGIFHNEVVLCESDSDCKLYSIIDKHLKRKDGMYSETLFIHSNGKHRMKNVIKALNTLGVNVGIIVDIDILAEKDTMERLCVSKGLSWDVISDDYSLVLSNIQGSEVKKERNEIKEKIEHILDQSEDRYVTKQEINRIHDLLKNSRWKNIKENGISALPRGDARVSFDKMNKILQNSGIYIVPVGELEGFVKEIGKHGPEWVNTLLEKYPDLDDEIYDDVKAFISTVCKYFDC